MFNLKNLKKEIEDMPICHQIEILRLCKNNLNLTINENNNGSFINLTKLSEYEIEQLEKYVNYVIEQKIELDTIENEKNRLENNFFNGNNNNIVDNNIIHNNSNSNSNNINISGNKDKEFKDNNEEIL